MNVGEMRQWYEKMIPWTTVVNCTIITDPTIWQFGFDLPCQSCNVM